MDGLASFSDRFMINYFIFAVSLDEITEITDENNIYNNSIYLIT